MVEDMTSYLPSRFNQVTLVEYVDDYVCAMFLPYWMFTSWMFTSYNKITIFCTKTVQNNANNQESLLVKWLLVKIEKSPFFFTFYLGTCFQVSEFPTYFLAKIASYKKIVNVCTNCIPNSCKKHSK